MGDVLLSLHISCQNQECTHIVWQLYFQIAMALVLHLYTQGYYRMLAFTSSNIKYIDNQLVTVIKIQMICKCKYKTI